MSILKYIFENCNDDDKVPDDPVDKAFDHLGRHPEKLDIEDMFWLDQILGDD